MGNQNIARHWIGIDSLLFFALTIAGTAGTVWFGLLQALLLAGALWLYLKRIRRNGRREPKSGGRSLSLAGTAAGIVLGAERVLTLLSFFMMTHVNPHGAWDAWSIWNLRARYLAGGAATWRYAVSKHIILQHPDYPLLTSSLIALAWTYAHSIGTTVPIAIALLFMVATVLVPVAGLVSLRGIVPGLCAGATLLAVPAWLKLGAAQYADVPLGFYFLVALALLSNSRNDNRFALLAGVSASLSAWTKDEGLMFTGVCLVVTLVLFGPKRTAILLAGALPVLLFLVWFKLRIAPGVDPMWRQGAGVMLAKFSAGDRYATIAAQFAKRAAAIPELALLPLFGLVLGFKPHRGTVGRVSLILRLSRCSRPTEAGNAGLRQPTGADHIRCARQAEIDAVLIFPSARRWQDMMVCSRPACDLRRPLQRSPRRPHHLLAFDQ